MKKLVRDKIPLMIASEHGSSGKKISMCLSKDEKIIYLAKKLLEEAEELQEALLHKTAESMIEEFADVLEVLDAIQDIMQFDDKNIMNVKTKKLQERGGFDNGFILDIDK